MGVEGARGSFRRKLFLHANLHPPLHASWVTTGCQVTIIWEVVGRGWGEACPLPCNQNNRNLPPRSFLAAISCRITFKESAPQLCHSAGICLSCCDIRDGDAELESAFTPPESFIIFLADKYPHAGGDGRKTFSFTPHRASK